MLEEKDLSEIEAQEHRCISRRFNFAPVPYGHKSREEFTEKLQAELVDIDFVYYGEVKLDITIYFDEQKRLETPELADLDNYAKLICDALKGPNGLLIDDTQIQSLSISWIDTLQPHYFTIVVDSAPDEYVMKPLSLYEMPDHLFYPVSHKSWAKERGKEEGIEQNQSLLAGLYIMIKRSRKFRHALRLKSYHRTDAYLRSRGLLPILKGFNKSRVAESGFQLYHLNEWTSKMDLDKAIDRINRPLREDGGGTSVFNSHSALKRGPKGTN